MQTLQRCRDLQQNPNREHRYGQLDANDLRLVGLQPLQSQLTEQYGRQECPDNPAEIISICGDSVPCMHDAVAFNSKIMALETQNNWNVFEVDRMDTMRQCKF